MKSEMPKKALDAADEVRRMLKDATGIKVRPGFLFESKRITDTRAVVVIPGRKVQRPVLNDFTSNGTPIDVRGGIGLAEAEDELRWEADIEKDAVWFDGPSYEEPPELKEVSGRIKVICHLSPDKGWGVLHEFLSSTKRSLVVAMYDFSAPHILTALEETMAIPDRKLRLVYDARKAAGIGKGAKESDITELDFLDRLRNVMGDRLSTMQASVGKGGLYASHYHIKVAVRDRSAFWLSSGNWQSSNQYATDAYDDEGESPTWYMSNFNREWHIVVEHGALAGQFQESVEYDFNASARSKTLTLPPEMDLEEEEEEEEEVESKALFKREPHVFDRLVVEEEMRIMPLLTPDNYFQRVLDLVKSAKTRLWFQNQSLNLQDVGWGEDRLWFDMNDDRFMSLCEALMQKQRDGVDVRIILRGDFDMKTYLERMKEVGFRMCDVSLQRRCHTKGIIVDSHHVLLGSHNWTNDGTLANRDASLLIVNQKVTDYYARALDHDWNMLAQRASQCPSDCARCAALCIARANWKGPLNA